MAEWFSPSTTLELTGYKHWRKIERFKLHEDVYDSCTMFAVEEGSFRYEIGKHHGEAKFGDLVVCPPGIPFRRETIQPLSFHYVSFRWIPAAQAQASETITFLEGRITLADTKRLSSTYSYLRKYPCNVNTIHTICHYVRDILQQYAMETNILEERELQQAEDPLMNRAIHFIRGNAFDTINLGILASMLDMSPVQLTRRFRSSFGQNPSEYVTELRLRKVCRLLEETSLSLDQIAEQCGYENGYYLSRIFRRKKSLSPSEYRKAHQI